MRATTVPGYSVTTTSTLGSKSDAPSIRGSSPQPTVAYEDNKCECGAAKVKSNIHSSWCPKAK